MRGNWHSDSNEHLLNLVQEISSPSSYSGISKGSSFHNSGIKTPSNGFKIQSTGNVSQSLQMQPHASAV